MLLGIFFLALLGSLILCIVLIRTQHVHAHLSMDRDLQGVQKFHAQPTPRVGGISILGGILLSGLVVLWTEPPSRILFSALLIASVPVFLSGLLEDVTKRVTPKWRLLAAFISAAAAITLCDATLPYVGITGFDRLMTQYPWIALAFTVFCVGGVCHSVNIIDGYNGLMGGVALCALTALAFVSLAVHDLPLLTMCLASAGAIMGFLIWNFPRGLIFAGDSGAYLIGFLLAEISVLLVARHPQEVSPWFPFLVLIYPVFETVFSIYRRKLQHVPAGLPDSMHMHQLIYKRLVRWMVGSCEAEHLTKRNSMTAPYLWGMAMFSIMPATIFWRYQLALQLFSLVFVAAYIWAYKKLVS